jgi:hypothetical protein
MPDPDDLARVAFEAQCEGTFEEGQGLAAWLALEEWRRDEYRYVAKAVLARWMLGTKVKPS